MNVIGEVICICYLSILSIADIRKRMLPTWLLGAGVILALAYRGIMREDSFFLWILGAAVGVVFFFISKLTREALGYGDSILIGVLGVYLGVWKVFCLLLTAFFLAAVYAVILLMKKKYRRKATFPFVPFLEAAYLLTLAAGG